MSASKILEILEKKRIMPVAERERFKRELKRDESDAKGEFPEISREMRKYTEKHPSEGKGIAMVNARALKQKMRALKQGEHIPLNKSERIFLEKEEKRLTEWCRKRMIPVEDTRMTPTLVGGASNPEFSKAVNGQVVEMSQEYVQNAHKLKNIKRLLHPDDPQAGNLDRIRPRRAETGSQ